MSGDTSNKTISTDNNHMKIEADFLRSRINRIICHHLALIINNATKQIGTGTFIEINDLRFVITAKHVIKYAEFDQLFINLGLQDQEDSLNKLNMWTDDILDVAFIQLDKSQTDFMRGLENKPLVIDKKKKGFTSKDFNSVALCGYPKSMWNEENKNIKATAFTIATQGFLPYEKWPLLAKGEFSPDDCIMVSLTDDDGQNRLIDKYGKPAAGLDPHGMSGGPLWVFDITTINDQTPKYALNGVLTGYLTERNDVFKIARLEKLIENIETKYGFKIPEA
jgi:hypothetical protein